MPYIIRDENENINGSFENQQDFTIEEIAEDSPELQEFLRRKPDENTALYKAENAFIDFCRSLNLPDKASREDFNNLTMSLKAEGKFMEATEIALNALALINDVTQHGGTWENISYHLLA